MSVLKRLWSGFEFSKSIPVSATFLLASLSFDAGMRWFGWIWLLLALVHYAANVLSSD